MDSLGFNNHVIDNKYTAGGSSSRSQFFDRIRSMGSLVRVIDVCFVLLLISCSSVYLPVAVKMSSEFLSEVMKLVSSTHAIFVIGNVIIIALVAQSGMFISQDDHDARKCVSDDFYDEYVKNSESKRGLTQSPTMIKGKLQADNNEFSAASINNNITTAGAESSLKSYRRTQSHTFERNDHVIKSHEELRRSQTDIKKCPRPTKNDGEKTEGRQLNNNVVDQLSNEEFQRRIEAFIQRQQRFLREEYLSVAVADQN